MERKQKDFEDFSIKCKASYEDIRKTYKDELSQFTKKAYKRNDKTVFPTNLERQNVHLADNVFHDSTIATVNCYESYQGTSKFLQIIKKWWNIVNCNFGDDCKHEFLNRFLIWLEQWHNDGENVGLTRDTHNALKRSTQVLLSLTKKFINKIDMPHNDMYVCVKKNHCVLFNIQESNINNIYKVGESDSAPIQIEFLSYLKKAELFKNPEKLRALKNTPYAISNDLCEEDRRELKVLREHLKKALNENKQAKIKGLKLEIDSKLYTAKQLEDLSDPDVSLSSSSDLEESSEGESKEEEKEKVKSKAEPSIAQTKKSKKRKQQKTPSPEGIKTRSNKKKKTARRF
ncbi:unnamed protein product [Ceutorhynchus assimilis]|uniref:Uncharacterized protein n=1 Tax=Ceutorhynchus assimilis TaxID=467358 RepID=A0A9N9MS10_9CUCU|nr:unnamed protein product [Ceutorhynchus assimilis]